MRAEDHYSEAEAYLGAAESYHLLASEHRDSDPVRAEMATQRAWKATSLALVHALLSMGAAHGSE